MDFSTSEHDYTDDDSIFPAYTDYINGLVGPWYAAGPDGLMYPASTTPFSAPPVWDTDEGPPVLDLRSSPRNADTTRLIPPEHVMPMHPEYPAATAPALQSFTTQRRSNNFAGPDRSLPPQATHPTLARSSSATDVDSQIGQIPPGSHHMRLPASSLTPVHMQSSPHIQQPQQENAVRPYGILSQQQAPPFPHHIDPGAYSNAPMIRPDDLLNNTHFFGIPLAVRETINLQITQLSTTADTHPNPDSRLLAGKQLAQGCMKIYQKVDQLLERARMQKQL
jgi:hypothetical protein